MTDVFDSIKKKLMNPEIQRREQARIAEETKIRASPEYKKMVERARMKAMLERDRTKIKEFYSHEEKTAPVGGPLGGILGNMATAANKEFAGKEARSGEGFINPNPPMPDWMKKKKVE
jgi:hypothetical protein